MPGTVLDSGNREVDIYLCLHPTFLHLHLVFLKPKKKMFLMNIKVDK